MRDEPRDLLDRSNVYSRFHFNFPFPQLPVESCCYLLGLPLYRFFHLPTPSPHHSITVGPRMVLSEVSCFIDSSNVRVAVVPSPS